MEGSGLGWSLKKWFIFAEKLHRDINNTRLLICDEFDLKNISKKIRIGVYSGQNPKGSTVVAFCNSSHSECLYLTSG